jgi:hypothetical protein
MKTDKLSKLDDIKFALLKKLPEIRSIADLIAILKTILETLGAKEEPAPSEAKPAPQPEKPTPKRDLILEGILRDQRRARSSYKFSEDRPLKDSW